MGPKSDVKTVEPTLKENLLPPLKIGPGRVPCLKMQFLGGDVGVNSDIQITNKGVMYMHTCIVTVGADNYRIIFLVVPPQFS